MMILPQSSARISKLKSEGIAKRKRLLALMPNEFTMPELASLSGITKDAAAAQIQKMLHWKDIEPTSNYKTPRVYRKLSAVKNA